MSKLSFRARALDASKPLPVFRCEDLPDLHEYASINRAVPQMPTGMEKEEESVCFFIAARLVVDHFGSVFTSRGATMLPAQACAKWPPYLRFRTHDGSRWILNIMTRFYHSCSYKVAAARYFIREPCCVRLFHLKLHPKAQRSHVTCICSTILLTFSSVEASGDRPWTWCTFREQMPGGDTEPTSPVWQLGVACWQLRLCHVCRTLPALGGECREKKSCRASPLFSHDIHLQNCTVQLEHNVLWHAWYGDDSVILEATSLVLFWSLDTMIGEAILKVFVFIDEKCEGPTKCNNNNF